MRTCLSAFRWGGWCFQLGAKILLISTLRDHAVFFFFFFPIGVGAAVIDNYLYVVGGHSGSSYLNTVQKYDPISDTWLDSAGMMYCRCNFGLTAL